jgi:hypothetical protein
MGTLSDDDDMPVVSPPRPGLSPIGSRRISRREGAAGRNGKSEPAASAPGTASEVWWQNFLYAHSWNSLKDLEAELGAPRFGASLSKTSAPGATLGDKEMSPGGGGIAARQAAIKEKLLLMAWATMRRHSSPDARPSRPHLRSLLELAEYRARSSRNCDGEEVVGLELEENASVGSDSEMVVDPASGRVHGKEGDINGRDANGKEESGESVVSMEVDEASVRAPSYAEVAARRAGARLKGKSVPR